MTRGWLGGDGNPFAAASSRDHSRNSAGIVRAQEVRINGLTVLRQRQPAVADPAGGSVVDAECRAAVASLLAKLRTHGLIA